VFNYCYHGTVDETFVTLLPNVKVVLRDGNTGYGVSPVATTRVVEFNDLPALERELSNCDVCIPSCAFLQPINHILLSTRLRVCWLSQ